MIARCTDEYNRQWISLPALTFDTLMREVLGTMTADIPGVTDPEVD